MANNFARGPQGVTSNDDGDDESRPFDEQRQQFSDFLSSAYEQAQAAGTRSVNVVTQTTMEDDGTITASPGGQATETVDGGSTESPDYFTAAPSSSYSRYSGTTLATQTSNQLQQTSSPENTSSPLLPAQQSNRDDGGGLSNGQLAAAIAVPIIVAALFALLVLLILRRRKQPSHDQARPDSRSAGFFGLREKWGSLKSSSSSQGEKSSEVISAHNNAYITGLDISSRSTSPPDDLSPPPYPTTNVPPVLVRDMTDFSPARQSHDLHAPAAAPVSEDFLTPNPSFLRSGRPGSARSINSDAYSDTASIHSARAARMSVGAIIVPGLHTAHDTSKSESVRDPFRTPTPSLMLGRGRRSRQGSGDSKVSGDSLGAL